MFDLILKWSQYMADKIKAAAKGRVRELPRVDLIPVANESCSDPSRIKEIGDLIATIIFKGRKRGRPSKVEEDLLDAA